MFVQLVIAAITTAPWLILLGVVPSACFTVPDALRIFSAGIPKPVLPKGAAMLLKNSAFTSLSSTRSCGRLGPAMLGCTVDKSSSIESVNSGSGAPGAQKNPLALLYFSTSSTVAGSRPVNFRKSSVAWSTGKKPIVAPYSGAMFAIVARSGTDSAAIPSP